MLRLCAYNNNNNGGDDCDYEDDDDDDQDEDEDDDGFPRVGRTNIISYNIILLCGVCVCVNEIHSY